MNTRLFALSLSLAMALGLSACSREESGSAATAPTIATPQAYEAVAAQGKGFSVGALMSAQTVYVLFDPQCPHCAHLWQAAQPLLGQTRFVWIPVAILGPKSLPQGAALLQAADPQATMAAHEQSVLGGSGGIAASASIPADVEQAIRANTTLLGQLGADAVPFIVARHRQSGQVVTQAGAMATDALARLIGATP